SFCVGLFWNVRKTSLPPAKSIPSWNPLATIEMMPGMMITSEIRKKMFRRPMMSSRRLGAAAAGLAASSAAMPGRVSSATCDPQQPGGSGPAEVEHDGQQVVRDDDG